MVSELDRFRDLDGIWNDILARSGSDSPFLTHEWLLSWWETFGQDRVLLLLIARKKGAIIGMAPLMKHDSFLPAVRATGVEFIGAPDADYHDFIILEDREASLELFLQCVFQSVGTPMLRLSEVPEGSPNLPALERVLHGFPDIQVRRSAETVCRFLVLDPDLSWEGEFRRLKPNMRTNLKRLLNRYNDMGELTLKDIHMGELHDNIMHLSDHHVERWTQRAGHSTLAETAHLNFLELLGKRALSKGWLRFTRLESAGRAVGLHYGFGYKGTYYYYLVAHNPDFSRYSPGKVHLYFLLRQAHQEGCKVLDLLRGKEPYKASWTDRFARNHEILLFRKDLRGLALYLWFHLAKPFLLRMGVTRPRGRGGRQDRAAARAGN